MIITCSWCSGKGNEISNNWGSVVVMKCNSCHHEWETIKDKEENND